LIVSKYGINRVWCFHVGKFGARCIQQGESKVIQISINLWIKLVSSSNPNKVVFTSIKYQSSAFGIVSAVPGGVVFEIAGLGVGVVSSG
jgi:hypothetical protein